MLFQAYLLITSSAGQTTLNLWGGTVSVTVQITQVPQRYHINATGPAKTVVRRVIGPYIIQPEMLF